MYLDHDEREGDARRRNEALAAELRERTGTHEVDAGSWGALLAIQFSTILAIGHEVQAAGPLGIEELRPTGEELMRELAAAGELLEMAAEESIILASLVMGVVRDFTQQAAAENRVRTPEGLDALIGRLHAHLSEMTIVTDGRTYVLVYDKSDGADRAPRRILVFDERFAEEWKQSSARSA
jgi:hypothetical protein